MGEAAARGRTDRVGPLCFLELILSLPHTKKTLLNQKSTNHNPSVTSSQAGSFFYCESKLELVQENIKYTQYIFRIQFLPYKYLYEALRP